MRRLLVILALVTALTSLARAAFPPGFLWGTAISGFQTEMGGKPGHNDPSSDWWVWVHDADNRSQNRVSADVPETGPAFYDKFRAQSRKARSGLRSNTLRLSIEWSRIFPTSTAGVDISGGIDLHVLQQLDALANQGEVAHYREVFRALRRAHLKPFVTLNHFSLPLWIHDPIKARDAFNGTDPNGPPPSGFGPAGWVDAVTATEFAKYAAYLGWKFGDQVDLWAPLNEPEVVAVSGYVNIPGLFAANFPPGAFSFTAAIQVMVNEITANAAAYDALKQWDTVDADGDGTPATVGLVQNMVAFHPKNPMSPLDVQGTQHADYLFNLLFLNGAIHGDVDANANGTIDSGEHHPELVGKADFVGVNYYFRAVVQGVGVPLTPAIPILDFIPTTSYQTPHNPTGMPCPSTCSDFGWEIYPIGLREMLTEVATYGLPVYITENGIADADDNQRPAYLVHHLEVLDQAIADSVADVRGYYHWALMDNFEWASGYWPQFGLYGVDTKKRLVTRQSGRDYKRIAKGNGVPADLVTLFGPP
ncbi:MAG: glycoside hydrolase family 1 protein [Deltaproteobacteria bacterium]|nr:MAG: glycoside hydrolase family 1 protein [Deltaproteobacteria bacterium]